jgi:hypothetical protein
VIRSLDDFLRPPTDEEREATRDFLRKWHLEEAMAETFEERALRLALIEVRAAAAGMPIVVNCTREAFDAEQRTYAAELEAIEQRRLRRTFKGW